MRWLAVCVVAFALAGCGGSGRVDQVVDDLPSGELESYCHSYAQGEAFGFSEEDAFASFQQGYTVNDPSAREVFEEIRSRC